MTFVIELDEGTAARRRVPFRLFSSDGTTPDTNASNGTVLASVNGGGQLSLGSISAISANAGLYYFELSQSNVSVLGSLVLYTDTIATDFSHHVATVQVVNFNPYSTQSNVNVTQISGDATAADNLEAAFDGTGYNSSLTVFVKDSIATIAGVTNIATDVAAVQADTDDIQTRLPAALVGGRIDADMGAISADAAAANNLEAAFDGTGYNSSLTVFVKDSIATIAGVTNIATDVAAVQADTDDIQTRLPAALVGGRIDANVGAISTDATAADNLEAAFDGTGYNSALTVFVKDSVATVAGVTNIATDVAAVQADTDDIQTRLPAALVGGRMDANVGAISTDATAADNLEAAFDGTGYSSAMTVVGASRLDSSVTINNADYSAVTVRVKPLAYSGLTVGVNDLASGVITSSAFGVSSIDAAALATDAVNEIADGVLDRNMATGADSGSSAVRTPRDALRALRNRVESDGTQVYVYEEDDVTIKWTASLTTVVSTNAHVSGMDPNA